MNEYETDILIWSEHRAAPLRGHVVGERVGGQIDCESSRRSSVWEASNYTPWCRCCVRR